MAYEPPFEKMLEIDALCMEITGLVGMLHRDSNLETSPTPIANSASARFARRS